MGNQEATILISPEAYKEFIKNEVYMEIIKDAVMNMESYEVKPFIRTLLNLEGTEE